MKLKHYAYSGLKISSELPIPEWEVFEKSSSFQNPDVQIRLKESIKRKDSPKPNFSFTKNQCRVFFPEAGEYTIRSGREIIIKPLLSAKKREIRLFLLGTSWGVLNYQRGNTIFHAGAVKVRDQVMAFCGPAKSGKSTLTAWLVKKGYPMVSDDLCRFDVDSESKLVIYPSFPRLKLWKDALKALEWDQKKLTRDHFRMDKYHLPQETIDPSSPLPVSKIFLLEWGPLNLTRLAGLEAVKSLVSQASYHSELLEPMGQVAAQWQRCVRVAKRVSVWKFTRPQGLSRMDETIQFLIDSSLAS